MMQADATYISPIVTADEAEDLNRAFCDAIGDPRLFLFCHYQPIPDNPQDPVARYIPNILNLFVFACDSCFFLADGETVRFLRDCKGFSKANKGYELNEALKIISSSIKDIQLLRACLAHNTSDDNGNYVARKKGKESTFIFDGKLTTQRAEYETWVNSVIGKNHPETKSEYEKLCAKLETIKKNLVSNISTFISCVKPLSDEYKKALISHWEERTIEKYAANPMKPSSQFFNQLIAVYFSIVAGKTTCTRKDLNAWVESSIGYAEGCNVSNLRTKISKLSKEINKLKWFIENKKSEISAEELSKFQEGLNELETSLSECQTNLDIAEKELNTVLEECKKGQIDCFCKNLKAQLSKTLILEHEKINSLLPEVFLQAHIKRTFPEIV